MEMPYIKYSNYQIIYADNKEEARNKYNNINNCSYFYGTCMAEKLEDNTVTCINKNTPVKQLELLQNE